MRGAAEDDGTAHGGRSQEGEQRVVGWQRGKFCQVGRWSQSLGHGAQIGKRRATSGQPDAAVAGGLLSIRQGRRSAAGTARHGGLRIQYIGGRRARVGRCCAALTASLYYTRCPPDLPGCDGDRCAGTQARDTRHCTES